MAEHYKQESTSLQLNPQLISDLQVESIQPTASEMAMAGALMDELTDPEERRQRTRKRLNYKDDGSQNVMTVTGMLSRNAELRAQLTVQRQGREEAATNKAAKLDTAPRSAPQVQVGGGCAAVGRSHASPRSTNAAGSVTPMAGTRFKNPSAKNKLAPRARSKRAAQARASPRRCHPRQRP